MGRRRVSPEPFEVSVEGLDAQGRGTALHEDKSLAVHGALPGERVLARHLFGRRFRGQAETLEVLAPAEDRVDAPCPSFGTCSACSLQHLAETRQLAFKQDRLLAL